ncbi:hypothetical protein CERSUDRAFT_99268 [Gelatoporia subvermispora B]|uniref:DRBM domain-containing protein n=1 Tax=Ceriporiopsis subvermispora (strain B) TaxID=914234 RepID=M2R2S1_CERS8|nr:hypothetical protein CERSUDRAFT_99268 [Gelatoporia subvermispora B]
MSTDDGVVALNNLLQQRNELHLLVWEDKPSGPRHDTIWTSRCRLQGEVIGEGQGGQKQKARNMAAKEAVKALTNLENH